MHVRLARSIAIALALAALALGGFVTIFGMVADLVCYDPGGCRAGPVWPIVLLGVGIAVLSFVALLRVSRPKPR